VIGLRQVDEMARDTHVGRGAARTQARHPEGITTDDMRQLQAARTGAATSRNDPRRHSLTRRNRIHTEELADRSGGGKLGGNDGGSARTRMDGDIRLPVSERAPGE
jgi:hypothetical protein